MIHSLRMLFRAALCLALYLFAVVAGWCDIHVCVINPSPWPSSFVIYSRLGDGQYDPATALAAWNLPGAYDYPAETGRFGNPCPTVSFVLPYAPGGYSVKNAFGSISGGYGDVNSDYLADDDVHYWPDNSYLSISTAGGADYIARGFYVSYVTPPRIAAPAGGADSAWEDLAEYFVAGFGFWVSLELAGLALRSVRLIRSSGASGDI